MQQPISQKSAHVLKCIPPVFWLQCLLIQAQLPRCNGVIGSKDTLETAFPFEQVAVGHGSPLVFGRCCLVQQSRAGHHERDVVVCTLNAGFRGPYRTVQDRTGPCNHFV